MEKTSYHHGDLKRALVEAGMDLLAREGAAAFSLRKVAVLAGVSHTAPYAHFADKQALIAAIVTEGYSRLHCRMLAALETGGLPESPSTEAEPSPSPDKQRARHFRARLLAVAYAYVRFAIEERELFGIIFSGLLEDEKQYPEYREITQSCYSLLLNEVRRCREHGLLPDESEELSATRLWSCLHGFCSLLIRGQISHLVLEKMTLPDLVAGLLLPE